MAAASCASSGCSLGRGTRALLAGVRGLGVLASSHCHGSSFSLGWQLRRGVFEKHGGESGNDSERMATRLRGVFATVILLVVVVAIVSGVGRNTMPDGELLRAGERYLTDEFQPAFSFEAVGKKGWIPDFEVAYVLVLVEGIKPRDGAIEFLNAEDFVVFDPSEPPGEADSMPAPKDMASWFQQHPYLQTEEAEPVKIG